MELSWERVEYSELVQQCQSFQSYLKTSKVSVGQHNQVLHVQKSMVEKTSDWEQYLRNLFIKGRQPAATHVFIFLLSDKCRNKKPYCLPIQYVPYHSLKDQDVRELTKNIRQDMAKLGMLAIGLLKAISMSLVPEGYEPYPFRNGVPECLEDMLKSIVATYRFRTTVSKYMSEGVDFSTYLYIPEIDAESGEAFHGRENHCHILKESGSTQERKNHQKPTYRALTMQC
ncbi:Hypothetical predicted protein [Paramuricea clavata]|uniref:Uncharacterized protein n=1 Tax=Paramuricea clavata TaxID=317549 RepID=A0A7D9LJL2_PARCT|nr:Hypothetical predicted protein [Paramuricea clavata]